MQTLMAVKKTQNMQKKSDFDEFEYYEHAFMNIANTILRILTVINR